MKIWSEIAGKRGRILLLGFQYTILLMCSVWCYAEGSVEDCLAQQDICGCIAQLDEDVISDRGLYYLAKAVYACGVSTIEDKKSLYVAARRAWDSVGYEGYRYLSSYYQIVDHYSRVSFDADSIRYYASKILNRPHDGSVHSISYAHNARLAYIESFNKSIDIYKRYDLYDQYIHSPEFEDLRVTDRALLYVSLAACVSTIDDSTYYELGFQEMSKAESMIDASLESKELPQNVIDYLLSLKSYITFGKAYCMDNLGDYTDALKAFKDYYVSAKNGKTMINAAIVANSIGSTYHKLGDYHAALRWSRISSKLYDDIRQDPHYHTQYLIYGQSCRSLGEQQLADSLFTMGMEASLGGCSMDSLSTCSLDRTNSPEFVLRYAIELLKSESHGDVSHRRGLVEDCLFFVEKIRSQQSDWRSNYYLIALFQELYEQKYLMEYRHGSPRSLFEAAGRLKNSVINREVSFYTSEVSDPISKHEGSIHFVEFADSLYAVTLYNDNYEVESIGSMIALKPELDRLLRSISDIETGIDAIVDKVGKLLFAKRMDSVSTVTIFPSESLYSMPLELLFDASNDLPGQKCNVQLCMNQNILPCSDEKSNQQHLRLGGYFDRVSSDAKIHLSGGGGMYLPDLPFVDRERQSLEKSFKYFSNYTTKELLLDDLSGLDIFHFAGHYVFNERRPDLSGLLIRRDTVIDYLTVDQMMRQSLSTKLVFLNACQTGAGKVVPYEGLVGMTQAAFGAGAESVLSTLWPVNDQIGYSISTKFYDHLKRGLAKDAALREAKSDYLSSVDPEYQHPYYWAGYVIMGDLSPIVSTSISQYSYMSLGWFLSLVCMAVWWYRSRL